MQTPVRTNTIYYIGIEFYTARHLYIVEGKGHDRPWGDAPTDQCGGCVNDINCQQAICMADPGSQRAYNFENVCQLMGFIYNKRKSITFYLALGSCLNIFGPQGESISQS